MFVLVLIFILSAFEEKKQKHILIPRSTSNLNRSVKMVVLYSGVQQFICTLFFSCPHKETHHFSQPCLFNIIELWSFAKFLS